MAVAAKWVVEILLLLHDPNLKQRQRRLPSIGRKWKRLVVLGILAFGSYSFVDTDDGDEFSYDAERFYWGSPKTTMTKTTMNNKVRHDLLTPHPIL